jgi:hypothetical protein
VVAAPAADLQAAVTSCGCFLLLLLLLLQQCEEKQSVHHENMQGQSLQGAVQMLMYCMVAEYGHHCVVSEVVCLAFFPGQVVAAWKESNKLKDVKIEELNFQLGQAAAQLEVSRKEVSVLQQQLNECKHERETTKQSTDQTEARLVLLQEEAAALQQQLADSRNDAQATRKAVEVSNAQLELFQEEVTALQEQLAGSKSEASVAYFAVSCKLSVLHLLCTALPRWPHLPIVDLLVSPAGWHHFKDHCSMYFTGVNRSCRTMMQP